MSWYLLYRYCFILLLRRWPEVRAGGETAIITTIYRLAIVTTMNIIAIITTLNRIAIIITINRVANTGAAIISYI